MPAVAHLYAHDGPSTGVTTTRDLDPASGVSANSNNSTNTSKAAVGAAGTIRHTRPGSITEGDESLGDADGQDGGGDGGDEGARGGSTARAAEATGPGLAKEAEAAAGKLLAATTKERQSVMSMSTVVLQEAKRNKRFRFFSEER